MAERRPAEIFPPGEFLRDELEARDWSQAEFSEIIGRPTRVVNEIIGGKRGVSPETAQELAAALGTSAQYWMNLESAYQLSKVSPVSNRISREANLREKFPIREMLRRGWIISSDNIDVIEAQICRFFEIDSTTSRLSLDHAARRTHDGEISSTQIAWLFRVKQLASTLYVDTYSESKLEIAIKKMTNFIENPEEIRHIPKILSECGVRFVVVEPMPSSKIDGVCTWLENGNSPVIGMSIRQDRIDNFWFVLRHELEHVLRGDGKDNAVVDIDIGPGSDFSGESHNSEIIADNAAAEFIVKKEKIDSFISRVRPLYSEQKILSFSKINNVHPGLVVGQLQKRGEIPYSNFRRYLVKVRHFITQTALTDGWGVSPQLCDRS